LIDIELVIDLFYHSIKISWEKISPEILEHLELKYGIERKPETIEKPVEPVEEVAPEKKYTLVDGIVPYLTQKGPEEIPVVKELHQLGGAIREGLKVAGYPVEGHPSTRGEPFKQISLKEISKGLKAVKQTPLGFIAGRPPQPTDIARKVFPDETSFEQTMQEAKVIDVPFKQAFKEAREQGLDVFPWKGGLFTTKLKEEEETKSPFDVYLKDIFKIEGGRTSKAIEKKEGFRTKYGVTERSHPEAWADQDVTKEEARKIYKTKYWDAVKGDLINTISPKVAFVLFDSAINHGQEFAVNNLQKTLGIAETGVLDSATIDSLKTTKDFDFLVDQMLGNRQAEYDRLIYNKPNEYEWAKEGWEDRIKYLRDKVKRMT